MMELRNGEQSANQMFEGAGVNCLKDIVCMESSIRIEVERHNGVTHKYN